MVDAISSAGGTPLVVSEGPAVLGVVHLKDVVKAGIRERFDELRYRRAELRSPVRLAEAAGALGMVPGDTGSFVELDPWLLARQIAAAGVVDEGAREMIIDTDPLEQFSDVKRVSAGQP